MESLKETQSGRKPLPWGWGHRGGSQGVQSPGPLADTERRPVSQDQKDRGRETELQAPQGAGEGPRPAPRRSPGTQLRMPHIPHPCRRQDPASARHSCTFWGPWSKGLTYK